MSQRFAKEERLKSKQDLARLFEEGTFVRKRFLALKSYQTKEKGQHQIAFSVPKRRFPRAVDRNRIKRRLLEAYRLNKDKLGLPTEYKMQLILIYNSSAEHNYQEIEKTLLKLFAESNNLS